MKREEKRKLIIIGAGPAGLSAGIYAARAGLSPVIIENATVGGQMSSAELVENYPGAPEIAGARLSEVMRRQAEKQGATLEQFDPFTSAELSSADKLVETENCRYIAEAVIIAAGASPVYLPESVEGKFRFRGVHYCALCDGNAYRGKSVGVVGGGNGALADALYLAGICERVTLIRRGSTFHAEQRLIDLAQREPKIRILYNTDLKALGGGDFLEYAEVERDGKRERISLSGIFCRLGNKPNSEPFSGVTLSRRGFIPTDISMRTNLARVYAAGDIREKECRQIVTAVSDGAIAALTAERELAEKG